jgi:putative membrane protein
MKNMKLETKTMKVKCQKICIALLFLVSATGFYSCKDDDDNQDYAISNQEFVTRASSSNKFEIASGALAVSKAQNAAVKQYGDHMVTDHTAAAVEMKNLASGKGWTVPEALQPKEQQNLDKLSALSGAAFDKEFVNVMVLSHQDAIALFETGASAMGVPDADLRAMASAKLPTLKEHLQHATELKAQVNP